LDTIQFIWNEQKNLANIRKHNISFDDAVKAYFDPEKLEIFDRKHSAIDEERWIYVGYAEGLIRCEGYIPRPLGAVLRVCTLNQIPYENNHTPLLGLNLTHNFLKL
jgi:uncharacterized DUF497 family protein